MADATRYMRVELPTDYEKTERVTVYGMNNTEIEVSSDLLVTADEIPREGEWYTAEEYREVLKAIYDMDSVELATEAFRKEIDGMEDSEFKRFVTANFGDITAESDKPYVSLADALYVARESEK